VRTSVSRYLSLTHRTIGRGDLGTAHDRLAGYEVVFPRDQHAPRPTRRPGDGRRMDQGGIRHEPGRFSLEVDGEVAYVTYSMLDDHTIDYTSTFVPPGLRLRGIGQRLVEHALTYAADRGLTVLPSCWFVKRVMDAGRG
jgi:predicted GNAT family acetyltransferase